MIKIMLTNVIPDKKEQEKHDLKILEWGCNKGESCTTVLELSKILTAEKNLSPDKIMESLINYLKENRNELILVDTSRDHYWRDVFEEQMPDIRIEHNPYPDDLFR